MNMGASGLGRQIRRDLRQITTGGQLNTADVWVHWQSAVHTFIHSQSVASATWTVYHGMDGKPLLAVIDATGKVVAAAIEHLSRNEVRVTPDSAITGTLICLRPGVAHDQEDAASSWAITHELTSLPIVQVVVNGLLSLAAVSRPSAQEVQVDFTDLSSGYALLAEPTHVFHQSTAAQVWTIAHNLGARPILQIVGDDNTSIAGELVHLDLNTAQFTAAEAVAGRALAVHTGSSTLAEFDPNVEASFPSTTPQSGSWKGLVHYVQPTKSGFRTFAEVQTGDVIVDFLHDVELPLGSRVLIDGQYYVQKDAGSELAEYWDLIIGGQRMLRTLLLTKQR